MARYSINPFDSRCPPNTPVSVIDLDNANRVASCHASLIDAMKAKALMMYDRNRRYGDPALKRFRIDSGPEALRSLADINGHRHWQQYSKSEYASIVDVVRAAVVHFYNIVPSDDDIPYGPVDEPDDFEPGYFNPADFVDDDDDIDGIGDGPSGVRTTLPPTPFSLPVNQARARPVDGQLEQRHPPIRRRYY